VCCCIQIHCSASATAPVPPAEKYFTDAVTGGFQYSLGNDWDSVLPGAALLMTSMGLQASAAKSYLENSLLAKWEVRGQTSLQLLLLA
jgi:hypothetical protein